MAGARRHRWLAPLSQLVVGLDVVPPADRPQPGDGALRRLLAPHGLQGEVAEVARVVLVGDVAGSEHLTDASPDGVRVELGQLASGLAAGHRPQPGG